MTISTSVSKESDFSEMRALIIDDNSVSRIALSTVLRDIRIGRVKTTPGTHQARALLQTESFDIILCEYHFSGSESGQDLLDDIRATRLVPFSTVFFMVTGEATYERVAAVVENAPDDYLLKPFKPAVLEERLQRVLTKKRALAAIHQKIERKEFDSALAGCVAVVRDKGTYWIEAAHLGAELCLRTKRHQQAQLFYELVLKQKPLTWAGMGIAQLAYANHDWVKAKATLETLVANHGAFAEAHDMLARICFEEGALVQALAALRRAVEATPANLARLQKAGTLGFFVGDPAEAETWLSKAYRLGTASKAFEIQSVMLLTLLAQSRGASGKDLERYCVVLENAAEKTPDDFRLKVMVQVAQGCVSLARRQPGGVVSRLRTMAEWVRQDGYDIDCAINHLALLSRVGSQEIRLPDAPDWARDIARRHCTSKLAADLLCAAARTTPDLVAVIEAEQASTHQLANEAMSRLLKADADGTAARLAELARTTLNARIFGLAENLALKHHERLSPASLELLAQLQVLRQQVCPVGAPTPLTRISESARTGRSLALD